MWLQLGGSVDHVEIVRNSAHYAMINYSIGIDKLAINSRTRRRSRLNGQKSTASKSSASSKTTMDYQPFQEPKNLSEHEPLSTSSAGRRTGSLTHAKQAYAHRSICPCSRLKSSSEDIFFGKRCQRARLIKFRLGLTGRHLF
jgi:hypothetical protein